jgi:hypothetical protein
VYILRKQLTPAGFSSNLGLGQDAEEGKSFGYSGYQLARSFYQRKGPDSSLVPRLDPSLPESIEMAEQSVRSGIATGRSDLNYDCSEPSYLSSPGATSEIALQPLQVTRDSRDENLDDQAAGIHEFSLPPVDGGKDAWLCLVGGFVLEMMVWGTWVSDRVERQLTCSRISLFFWSLSRLLYHT